MFINGKHYPNITCPHCRMRHPAEFTCAEAKRIADEQRAEREASQQESDNSLLAAQKAYLEGLPVEQRVRILEAQMRKLVGVEWPSLFD